MFHLADDEGADWEEHARAIAEARSDLTRTLPEASRRCAVGETVDFVWEPERRLGKDGDDEEGVWIVSVTEARGMPGPAFAWTVYQKAMRKFERRRWADLHAVVLDPNPLPLRRDAVSQRSTGRRPPRS